MKRKIWAGITVSLVTLVGCGSDGPKEPTYPIRVVSERVAEDAVEQYTQVDMDLMSTTELASWSTPATEGHTWFASDFQLEAGEHEVVLLEYRENRTYAIRDPKLQVLVDGDLGEPTALCMSPDGRLRFVIENDDGAGQQPVGELFDCYNPHLRVRSRK